MKINEPVTNNEVKMKEGSILVSKTDLKGAITYCNKDFIEISGFHESELIGKNHNMVRHPDMPPEAFEWLWQDIKKGEVWTAPVKNRAKNGDYYWVNANVSPVYENGEIVEYMSVRTRPTDAEIAAAEAFYQDVRSGKAKVEALGTPPLMSKLKAIPSFTLQYIGVGVFALIMLVMAALLFSGVDATTVAQTMVVATVVFSVLGILLVKKITSPFDYFRDKLTEIRDGNFFNWVNIARTDDIGTLFKMLFSVQVRLGFDVMDARENAERGKGIETALDGASSGVMILNNDLTISYINETLYDVFRQAETQIAQEIQGFKVATLADSSVLNFYPNSSQKQSEIKHLSQATKEELNLGGKLFEIISSPVISNGERLGTVMEWKDLTTERSLEQEIEHLVVAAQSGDFSQRIDNKNLTGFFKNLSSNLNDMLDLLDTAFADVNEVMSDLSNGELSYTIDRAYDGVFGDVKDNVNTTIMRLREIVGGIRDSAAMIDSSSQEISSGNNNLSSRTEQQAAALEQVAASMEEITSIVKQNADNANQANQLVSDAGDTADKGGNVVTKAIQAMHEINDSSSKIAEIIGVIDEIAFQTNLLALNASVEAARAGEQGRGFAVVATEVRNLAQRSATAAKEIKDLIQDSVNKVKAGSELVNESGETLQDIVTGVRKVRDIVGEIAAASTEQSAGVDQVSKALTSMDDMTQQNAALAEEASAASTNMSEQANTMNKQAQFFKMNSPAKVIENSLDFKLAKTKHLAWKERLRKFLDGKEELTRDMTVSHRHCDLGKWIYSDGLKNYGQHAEMGHMEHVHKDMHGFIDDLIEAKEDGDDTKAENLYLQVVKNSEKVVDNLNIIENKIKG